MSQADCGQVTKIRKKRKELLLQLRVARDRGDIAVLKHDKFIVKPRSQNAGFNTYTFSNIAI